MVDFQKVVRDGKVAILVSPGFGAGWSTWEYGSELSEFMLFDSGLVEMAERGASSDEVEAYLKSKFGEDLYVYMGGWPAEIQWLPVGTPFYVHEYDGSESLRTGADLVRTA